MASSESVGRRGLSSLTMHLLTCNTGNSTKGFVKVNENLRSSDMNYLRIADRAARAAILCIMAPAADQLLDRALAARADLLERPGVTAIRLFNGSADGIDGLVFEIFADVLTVQIHEGRLSLRMDDVRRLAGELLDRLSARAVYRKWFVRDRARLSAAQAAEHGSVRPWI